MSDEGRLIAHRYRLHQQIGSGAMGVVWRAVDERLNRTVAVKQLLLQPGYTNEETEEARQRSMREGRIAARLQHQNAIAIFDVAEDEGQPVLVMEYLPSLSLATVLTEQGLLAPPRVAWIGAQVAGALAAAHMAGIVHRDLKPGNILLGDSGVAKITDFGISRAIGDVSVTKSGILAGTPAYLSPEVALGRDPAPASDVFSLGSTLYAAIEGEPPFGVDENAISLLHRVARGEVAQPQQAGAMAPALMQLLQPDPVDRPTMAQARDILQSVVDGRPLPPPSPGAVPPHRGGTRPSPTPATNPNPPTQVGSASSVRQSKPRSPTKALLLWAMALLIAILAGILFANFYRSQPLSTEGQRAAASSISPSATQAAGTSTPAEPTATSPTSSASSTTSTTTTTSTDENPEYDPAEVVADYYSLVPDDPEEAWQMLGPGLQEQGMRNYTAFWETIDEVDIVEDPVANGSYVVVTLLYTKTNGETSEEQHTLEMVTGDNGEPLINNQLS